MPAGRRDERGSVAEFVLVLLVLIPVVLGILQLGLVLHVRNTLTAAASDGARAAAPLGADPEAAVTRARGLITTALSDRYAGRISAATEPSPAGTLIVVDVEAEVPALGLFGPGVPLHVRGHALQEQEP